MFRNYTFPLISIICILMTLSACNGDADGTATVIDDTRPSVSIVPALRALQIDNKIRLNFSESIDTTTLQLSGDLATESNGGIWSRTNVNDDTLIISPAANWPTGAGHTLSVNASDLAGNKMPVLSMTYDIYDATIYYVSSSASDDKGDGLSPLTAKKTIMAAISTATLPPAVVLVNAGTYIVNSNPANPDHIVLNEGVSLYGGYDTGFTQRNTNIHNSIIIDKSNYATADNSKPNRVLEAGAGITSTTTVEGFTFIGSIEEPADYTAAILVHSGASPTIQNNTLNGGGGNQFSHAIVNIQSSAPRVLFNTINGGSGNNESRGIENIASSPLIIDNTIYGGTGGTSSGIFNRNHSAPVIKDNQINGGASSFTYAIYNESSSPNITGNTIHGGNGFNSSYGIYNFDSVTDIHNNIIFGGVSINVSYGISSNNTTSYIRNNIIDGGNGLISYGILINSKNIFIDNNIIFTSGGSGAAYCLLEANVLSDPATLRNNNLYQCSTALYLDFDENANCSSGANCLTSITDVNLLNDSNASDNISTNPQFKDMYGPDNDLSTLTDNDWHFSSLSPSIMTHGGLNGISEGGWGFIEDKDKRERPADETPWSIGAYEP